MSEAQDALSTRAIELAAACKQLAEMTHERINRHEIRCDGREAANKDDRHEIANRIMDVVAELRLEIATGETKAETRYHDGMAKVHNRINAAFFSALALAGTIIMMLFGLIAWLAPRVLHIQ